MLLPWGTIGEWIGLEETGHGEGRLCLVLHQVTSGLQSGRWLRVVDPLPLCPSALQSTCAVSSSELAPAFPAGFSLTVESSRSGVHWCPLEVQECSRWNFFPAVGRNQTLLKLTVLHSAEFSSGISEQRNSLPQPMSLSDTDRVPSPRS